MLRILSNFSSASPGGNEYYESATGILMAGLQSSQGQERERNATKQSGLSRSPFARNCCHNPRRSFPSVRMPLKLIAMRFSFAINSYPAWGALLRISHFSRPIAPLRSDSQIATLMAISMPKPRPMPMPICTCQLAQKDAATITQWEWHRQPIGAQRQEIGGRRQNRNCNWS